MWFIQGLQECFNIFKSVSVIHHIKMKENCVIVSIEAEKALEKFNIHLWIEWIPTQQSGYRCNIPQHDKGKKKKKQQHDKGNKWQPHSWHYTQWQKTENFSLRSGTRKECLLLPLLFNIVLEALARATRQEKVIKVIEIRKEEVKLSLHVDNMIYI